NLDCMVERSATHLHREGITTALDGGELAMAMAGGPPRPLLKIHGCWIRDQYRTVWCEAQVAGDAVIGTRLTTATTQLNAHLVEKDLLIVGFWTDWAYLASALSQVLNTVAPRRVTVVDLADTDALREKAPGLWSWINARAWCHVQEDATSFLGELRRRV